MSRVFAFMGRSLPPFILVLAAIVGCAESAPAIDAELPPDAAPPDAALDELAPDAGCTSPEVLDCVDTTPDPTCDAAWIAAVRGRLVDDTGAPIEDGRAQLCARLSPDDRLVCLVPPRTAADGTFTILLADTVRCLRAATLRYVVPAGGLATTYCELDLDLAADGVVRLPEDTVAFRVQPAVGLPPRGEETATRRVDLGPIVLELAPSSLAHDAPYERLGARFVEAPRSCVPALRAMEGLIALAPEAQLDPSATVQVRAEGSVPGDRIELHVLGGLGTLLADGTPVDEGEIGLLGTGIVDADGLVTFEAGTRLTYLSWLGYRHASPMP